MEKATFLSLQPRFPTPAFPHPPPRVAGASPAPKNALPRWAPRYKLPPHTVTALGHPRRMRSSLFISPTHLPFILDMERAVHPPPSRAPPAVAYGLLTIPALPQDTVMFQEPSTRSDEEEGTRRWASRSGCYRKIDANGRIRLLHFVVSNNQNTSSLKRRLGPPPPQKKKKKGGGGGGGGGAPGARKTQLKGRH